MKIRHQHILELFRARLSWLIDKANTVIDSAINTENDLKLHLKERGITDSEFLNYLRYLIGKEYLKPYTHSDDLGTVKLTSKGYEWALELKSEEILKLTPGIYGIRINLKALWDHKIKKLFKRGNKKK